MGNYSSGIPRIHPWGSFKISPMTKQKLETFIWKCPHCSFKNVVNLEYYIEPTCETCGGYLDIDEFEIAGYCRRYCREKDTAE